MSLYLKSIEKQMNAALVKDGIIGVEVTFISQNQISIWSESLEMYQKARVIMDKAAKFQDEEHDEELGHFGYYDY